MAHPEEVAALIHREYSRRHSLAHLRYEAAQMVPLLRADLLEIGHMHPGRWQHIADVYGEMGMLHTGFDLKGFLFEPHPPSPDLTWWFVGFGVLGLFSEQRTAARGESVRRFFPDPHIAAQSPG